MLAPIDDTYKRQNLLRQVYTKTIDLVIHNEKNIADRTNIFLTFNTLLFVAFTQLLIHENDYPQYNILIILVCILGIVLCIFQINLIRSILDNLIYWRGILNKIEEETDYWYPQSKVAEEDYAIFMKKTNKDIDKFMNDRYKSNNYIKRKSSFIYKIFKMDKYVMYSSELLGLYAPIIISILWLFAIITIIFTMK